MVLILHDASWCTCSRFQNSIMFQQVLVLSYTLVTQGVNFSSVSNLARAPFGGSSVSIIFQIGRLWIIGCCKLFDDLEVYSQSLQLHVVLKDASIISKIQFYMSLVKLGKLWKLKSYISWNSMDCASVAVKRRYYWLNCVVRCTSFN